MNYFLDLGIIPTIITFVCGLITLGLYIVFKITNNYDQLSLIVCAFLSFVFFQPCGLSLEGLTPVFHII
ncbi:MAG: hypothetical protein GX069_09500 [Tissierellia bacterium]|nr:hypothetical protein [Tissierellia bacterium]